VLMGCYLNVMQLNKYGTCSSIYLFIVVPWLTFLCLIFYIYFFID
jgi:hypothetical protein